MVFLELLIYANQNNSVFTRIFWVVFFPIFLFFFLNKFQFLVQLTMEN